MLHAMWTTPLHPLPSSATSSATPSPSPSPSAQYTHTACYALHLPPFSTRHFPAHATSIKYSSQYWICNTRALHESFCLQHLQDTRGAVMATVAEKDSQRSTPLELEVVESREANSRVVLSIVVPPNVCKESYDQVLMDLSKKTKVPGFRPGKRVPESILVNFIGQKQVRASAIEAVLRKTFPEAMASVAGRALKDTERIVTEFDDLQATFSPSSCLRYNVAVDVAPDVGWITDNAYKNLIVEVEFDHDESAVKRAADAELRTRHKDLGSLRVVTDRGIQIGDVVILDITAKRITGDEVEGDKILSAEQKGFQLDTEEGSKFLPGFVDALLGLEKGQSRTFDLTFPLIWEQEALRGIKARFTADCKELFLRILPELDDSIASKLHENCISLDQVKESLLKKHKLIVEKAKNDATRAAIIEQLTKYTEEELNEEIQNAIAEFKKYGQEFDEGRVKEQACELLEGSKVVDWLVEHSDIKYVKKNATTDVARK
ncbi:hypothetical protein O6H91_21G070300 [Diphasiastrum complanatum]|uniref:Uncharacterized protein n=1 Tax=Diphasiastrum complanatum TaxID=34168 RepID=A0ACC2ALL5_DIPCM|nr:hypothetical protein O6H91_21G070300 [Diphasiastrum complanatum]